MVRLAYELSSQLYKFYNVNYVYSRNQINIFMLALTSLMSNLSYI